MCRVWSGGCSAPRVPCALASPVWPRPRVLSLPRRLVASFPAHLHRGWARTSTPGGFAHWSGRARTGCGSRPDGRLGIGGCCSSRGSHQRLVRPAVLAEAWPPPDPGGPGWARPSPGAASSTRRVAPLFQGRAAHALMIGSGRGVGASRSLDPRPLLGSRRPDPAVLPDRRSGRDHRAPAGAALSRCAGNHEAGTPAGRLVVADAPPACGRPWSTSTSFASPAPTSSRWRSTPPRRAARGHGGVQRVLRGRLVEWAPQRRTGDRRDTHAYRRGSAARARHPAGEGGRTSSRGPARSTRCSGPTARSPWLASHLVAEVATPASCLGP